MIQYFLHGALAQLGARHTGSVEATGSSPVCSIPKAFYSELWNYIQQFRFFVRIHTGSIASKIWCRIIFLSPLILQSFMLRYSMCENSNKTSYTL